MKDQDDLNLGRAISKPAFPKSEIRSRIRGTLEPEAVGGTPRHRGTSRGWAVGVGRSALGIAVALLLFVSGLEYGRHLERGGSEDRGGSESVAAASISLPLAIQQEGTEYVRVLTQAGQVIEGLSPEERDEVRAAAYAVLYGAAAELLRSALDEEVAGPLYRVLQAQRQRERGLGNAGDIWF